MDPPGELTTSLRKFRALRSAAKNFCWSPKSILPVIVIVAASVVAKVAASAGLAGTKAARPRAIAAADANPQSAVRQANFPLLQQLQSPEKAFSESGKLMHDVS